MDLRHSKATLISLGAVDTTGTPAANQVARFFDADTVQGSANFTFSGTILALTGNMTISSFLSIGTTPALTGSIRLPNSGSIVFRDSEDTEDLVVISFAASDQLDIGNRNDPGNIESLQLNAEQVLIPAGTFQVQGDFDGALTVRTATQGVMFRVNSTDREIEFTGTAERAKTTLLMATATVLTPSGSSVFAAGLIPAGALVIAITTRVITTVTGPTGYDVGDGTTVDLWGNSIAVAAGSTSDLTDQIGQAVAVYPFGNDVRITSDGVDFTGGEIRITVHYMTVTAPTS